MQGTAPTHRNPLMKPAEQGGRSAGFEVPDDDLINQCISISHCMKSFSYNMILFEQKPTLG